MLRFLRTGKTGNVQALGIKWAMFLTHSFFRVLLGLCVACDSEEFLVHQETQDERFSFILGLKSVFMVTKLIPFISYVYLITI